MLTRSKARLVVVIVAAASAVASACSSPAEDVAKTGSAACAGEAHPHVELDRDVSFVRDVYPVLLASCAFPTCHGASSGVPLSFGLRGESAPSSIRQRLLARSKVSSMPFVTPGKPDQSWLLRKVDGDFCGVACAGGCGDRMPKGGETLEPAALTTLATWIARGAPDN